MFDASSVKKQAKQQLKGNYSTLLAASIIIGAIFFILNLTAQKIVISAPSLSFTFRIVQFCITSLFTFAFTYLCLKLVKTRGNAVFSDFTDGLTQFKPAILGTLWYFLFIILWTFLCLVPFSIIVPLLIAIFSISMFDFSKFGEWDFSFSQTFNSFEDVNEFFINMFRNYLGLALIVVIAVFLLIFVLFIKSIRYSFMSFILAESVHNNKNMSVNKAMRLSIEITKGHTGELIAFALSFIGWILLCLIPSAIVSGLDEVIADPKILQLLSSFLSSISLAFVTPYITTSYVNAYLNLKQYAFDTGRIKSEDFQ